MKRSRWLAAMALVGLGLTTAFVELYGASADGAGASSSAVASPTGVERADVAARLAAMSAGDAAPTNVQIAKGDLRSAFAALGAGGGVSPSVTDPRTGRPWDESPVYVVTMDGHFRLGEAHVPRGQSLPEGTVMEVVVDALSEQVVSRHVQSTPAADLSGLGGAVAEG